jgi:hypothetical protein
MAEPSRSDPVKHLLNFWALAEVSVERPETSPALASFLLNTPIDQQLIHRSNTEFSSVLHCAHS